MSAEFDRIIEDNFTDREQAKAEVGAFVGSMMLNPGKPLASIPSFEALAQFPRVTDPFRLP